MPIVAQNNPSDGLPQYFKSLTELDQWNAALHRKSDAIAVQGFCARSDISGTGCEGKGKLLVCHDYKGGYTESPSSLSYTFNFWERCDTFIYFSHHRVTIPPPGWITTAHRQGVKMLGTLIFEGSGEEDCLRLLVGHLPKSKTGPVTASSSPLTYLPLSSHYARVFANLAAERGFDGYLLNFECPLAGRAEQVRLLDGWITLLDAELRRLIGPHAQTIWYDSLIVTGELRWQDRVNSLNLPFFLSSTSFFTNYTWPPQFPSLCAQYLFSLDQELMLSKPKTLQDIFVGVDVWGRGSHGNGGFGSYRAISHADPEFLGLSIALFGPAWSWESEQDKEGWDWEKWWAYERKLWVGPEEPNEKVDVPDMPSREGQLPCPHGEFQPISSFFTCLPAPNPALLPFHTTFSPGIGYAWFVEGHQAMHKPSGWTDIDKQTSLGNLIWPRPSLSWEGEPREEPLPLCSPSICNDDAWNGGSSLRLTLSSPGLDADDAFFQCIWIPVQSLALSPQMSYEVVLVYKIIASDGDVDVGLSARVLSDGSGDSLEVNAGAEGSSSDLAHGWNQTTVQLIYKDSHPIDLSCALGFVVAIAQEDPTQPYEVILQIGQLNVRPTPSPKAVAVQPRILWVDFESFQTPSMSHNTPNQPTASSTLTLTWEVSVSLGAAPRLQLVSAEDPRPSWILHRTDYWFPSFVYFNIYGQVHNQQSTWNPDDAVFIGTTGLDCVRNRFIMDKQALGLRGLVRFYVQGVTNSGDVLPWEFCSYVEVMIS